MVGDTLYLPFLEMLRAAGLNVISSSSIEKDEFAFAIGGELTRRYNFQSLSKKLKQELIPVDLLKKMRKKGADRQSEEANG